MQQIKTIATAVERVTWDRIPESVILRYEEGMARLRAGCRGRQFKTSSVKLYNELFREYGYTKTV